MLGQASRLSIRNDRQDAGPTGNLSHPRTYAGSDRPPCRSIMFGAARASGAHQLRNREVAFPAFRGAERNDFQFPRQMNRHLEK